MNFNEKLMACTALRGVWLFQPATAGAQSASEAQKIERLERQTELLQRQLKEIQSELAQTRKRTEKVEAKVEAAPARYSAPPPMATKGPPLPPPPDRVKVTLGGFKPRRRCGDNTTWSTTLERPSRQPRIRSHRFTTRRNFTGPPGRAESRCSSRATSIPTRSFPGITSRTSWASATRRITTRATAGLRVCDTLISPTTNSGWGFHILAGQTWSLLTQNQVGITPRKENIPLTIDANYVVGFNYLRQWQIRAVGDVFPGISLGVSVENPAAIVGASTATAPLGTGGAFASGGIVNGTVVNFVNTGGGGDFLQNVNVTADQA